MHATSINTPHAETHLPISPQLMLPHGVWHVLRAWWIRELTLLFGHYALMQRLSHALRPRKPLITQWTSRIIACLSPLSDGLPDAGRNKPYLEV